MLRRPFEGSFTMTRRTCTGELPCVRHERRTCVLRRGGGTEEPPRSTVVSRTFFSGRRVESRLSEILPEPVTTLDMEPEMEDRSAGETLASTARRVTAPEIEAAGFSEIEAKRPATLSMLSVMDEARFSDAPLNPVMILVALSERTDAKSSDMVRAPVKTLAVTSDTAGVSVSPLNLLMILSTTSERGGASDRNLPADLLMLSDRLATRLSDIPLNP